MINYKFLEIMPISITKELVFTVYIYGRVLNIKGVHHQVEKIYELQHHSSKWVVTNFRHIFIWWSIRNPKKNLHKKELFLTFICKFFCALRKQTHKIRFYKRRILITVHDVCNKCALLQEWMLKNLSKSFAQSLNPPAPEVRGRKYF